MKKLLFFYLFITYSLLIHSQSLSPFIVIDQFGYLPDGQKTAIIRDPQTGFDADESFTPGTTYAVVHSTTLNEVFTGQPVAWNSGAEDPSSGDKVWKFDFTPLDQEGAYYILDKEKNVRSFEFQISESVYHNVLRTALRAFYYQRVGFAKVLPYADEGWTDGASHLGSLQDKQARQYNLSNDATTERDLSGGWYDAGDYNKYTNWTANYIVDFMRAYLDAPDAWNDDNNLPESGNGIPDLLDEAKWGLDHLLRMQQADGGVLSIVGLDHASPPSGATGPSLYGTASTSATLNTASAFAISQKVYGTLGMTDYANELKDAAIKAWSWAESNPNVIFYNNDAASGTAGLGSGQQEVDEYGQLMTKLEAAVFLLELTDDPVYKDFIDSTYTQAHLMQWTYASPFELEAQEALLHYASLPNATAAVKDHIQNTYKTAMNGTDNLAAYNSEKDPYQAHIQTYTWASNSVKSSQGLMFMDLARYMPTEYDETEMSDIASNFIHYLHGVNPLNFVYLSNMYPYGAENGVNEFYHTWYANGSEKWDRVGVSTYGPAPGFVVGGPNPSYNRDGCCPDNCGGTENNSICTSEVLPTDQPDQKSYKDFNTSWPLNSWELTENSNGYQLRYLRLLSRFVRGSYDCNGVKNGMAKFDACGTCSGGDTGITPIENATDCQNLVTRLVSFREEVSIYPNPGHQITISGEAGVSYQLTVASTSTTLITKEFYQSTTVDISPFATGLYLFKLKSPNGIQIKKVWKR